MLDIPQAAVEVTDLVKRYGATTAVNCTSFIAEAGQVTAVLGPNGAGKTTTIECCEGLRRPDGGGIRILGHDPMLDGEWLRARVGVMLQGGGMPGAARAGDVLQLAASMYARPRDPAELIAALDLTGQVATPVRRLSGGQQQRLALAVALVGRPLVAFLDEPTTGLDPQARFVVWDLIGQLRESGVAVVLTTHLLDEAERLADHVVLMANGTVVAQGSPQQLTGGGGHTLRFDAAAGLDLSELETNLPPGIAITEVRAGRYVVGSLVVGKSVGNPGNPGNPANPGKNVADVRPHAQLGPEEIATVTSWCARLGMMPEGLTLGRRSLEDVFLEVAARKPHPVAAK